MAVKIDKSKMVVNLTRRFKLVPHIDRVVEQGDFEWSYDYTPKRGDDAWHPSGDCTPGLLDLYCKATGQVEERPFSGSLYKTFQVGHFWHAYLQHLVLHKLEFCEPQAIERRGHRYWGDVERFSKADLYYNKIPMPEFAPNLPHDDLHLLRPQPFHWVTGSGDLAPADIPGHGEYVVDFKTMHERDFKKNGVPSWCADKYEAQINIYMDFFDLDKGMIVAIQKDSPHDMKEFEFVRNQPLIDAIYEKWHLVSMCVTEGIVPPADEDIHLPFTGPIAT